MLYPPLPQCRASKELGFWTQEPKLPVDQSSLSRNSSELQNSNDEKRIAEETLIYEKLKSVDLGFMAMRDGIAQALEN